MRRITVRFPRILFAALLTMMLLSMTVVPGWVEGNSRLDELNREIERIRQQEKQQQQQIKNMEYQLSQIRQEKAQVEKDLMAIDLKMNETQSRIDALQKDIDTTTAEAEQAARELDAAEQRVAERDQLLKTRVRVMYQVGEVSYLEVLLGSKGFGDFIQRLKAIKLIVDQDTKILEDNKFDRDMIAQKKKEIEDHLVTLQGLFAEAEQLKAELKQQQKQRLVVIAELKEKEGEIESVLHEMDAYLNELANKQAKLLAQKNQLLLQEEYKGGVFAWPVPDSYRITSEFGYRKDPFTGKTSGHNGMDIGAPQGTTIVAAADGVVSVASYVRGYGNTVMIEHGGNVRTLYGHIRNGGIMVKVGDKVKKGQKIAEVGSTGRSTGPHLHFGVYKNDQAVNPRDYLK